MESSSFTLNMLLQQRFLLLASLIMMLLNWVNYYHLKERSCNWISWRKRLHSCYTSKE